MEPLEPIACNLSLTEGATQALAWRSLHERAIARERIEGGVKLTFPSALGGRVADLAAREAECCAFLSITVEEADEVISLRITSEHRDGEPVIHALAGVRG